MSSSSLLHPVGKDYRQPRARDYRKVSAADRLAKSRAPPSPPSWRRARTPSTTHFCCVIKGMIFSFLYPWESEIRTILYHNHSACLAFFSSCSKWQVYSGIITNLFVSKSQLPFFKISHLSLLLPDMFPVVMMCGLEESIWSQIGGCYLVWAQQEADGWQEGKKLLYIHT